MKNKKINWHTLQTWDLRDLLHAKKLHVDKPYMGEAIPDPAETYPQNKRGKMFPLMLVSSFNNDPELVEILIVEGADVNEMEPSTGVTALHFAAARNRNSKIAKELLDNGANIEFADFERRTPLMLASIMGNKGPLNLLGSRGAEVNGHDMSGFTPVMLASIKNNDPDIISDLVALGADVNITTETGRTALTFSGHNPNPEITHRLLDNGAKVGKIAHDGTNAIGIFEEIYEDKPYPAYKQLLLRLKKT